MEEWILGRAATSNCGEAVSCGSIAADSKNIETLCLGALTFASASRITWFGCERLTD